MKKLLVFILFSLYTISVAEAQTKTRNIPFLPYAGVQTKQAKAIEAKKRANSPQKNKTYETIFFNKGSDDLRNDQIEKIIRIGKRMEKARTSFFTVVAYTSPEISSELAHARANTVMHALSDFRIGEPVLHIEHKRSSVKNPNKVEVYMSASTSSLGAASSNFGGSY